MQQASTEHWTWVCSENNQQHCPDDKHRAKQQFQLNIMCIVHSMEKYSDEKKERKKTVFVSLCFTKLIVNYLVCNLQCYVIIKWISLAERGCTVRQQCSIG